MAECPIHDFPASDDIRVILERSDDPDVTLVTDEIHSILERITNPDLLVTLICDFAEHICAVKPSPFDAPRWLRAARNWRTDKEAAWKASAQALDRSVHMPVSEPQATAASIVADAAQAADYAASAANDTDAAKDARDIVDDAVDGMVEFGDDPIPESIWQLEHTRILACTCPRTSQKSQSWLRSRNSLLAS